MLTPGELADLRETLEETLPDTCLVQRTAGTVDAMGKPVPGTAIAGTYACRISPVAMDPFEILVAGQVQAIGTHTITFPALADIRPSDRILSGTRRFNVTGGTGDRSWEISKRITVNEVNEAEGN